MNRDAQKDLNQRQDRFNWEVRRELGIIDHLIKNILERLTKLEAKT